MQLIYFLDYCTRKKMQKKKIIADYIDNNNYSETARMNNVSVNTVKSIVIRNDEVAKKCKQKKN